MQLSQLQLSICVATLALGISVLPEVRRKLSQPSGMPLPLFLLSNLLSEKQAGVCPPLQRQHHQGDGGYE